MQMKKILLTDRGGELTGRKQEPESREALIERGAFRMGASYGVSIILSTNVKDQK